MGKENTFELFKGFVESSGHLPWHAKDFKEMRNLYHWYIDNRKTYEPLKQYLFEHNIPTYKEFLIEEDNKKIFEAVKEFIIKNNYLPTNDDYFEILEHTNHIYKIESWISTNRLKYKPFKDFLKEYKNNHKLMSSEKGKSDQKFAFYEEKLDYFIKTYKKLPEYGGYINLGVVDEYDLAKFLDINRSKLTKVLHDNDEIVKKFLIVREERLKNLGFLEAEQRKEERKMYPKEKKKKAILEPVPRPDLPRFNVASILRDIQVEKLTTEQQITNLESEINKEIIENRPDLGLFLKRENELKSKKIRLVYESSEKENVVKSLLEEEILDTSASLDDIVEEAKNKKDLNLEELISEISLFYDIEMVRKEDDFIEFNLNHNLKGLKNLNIKIGIKDNILLFNDLTNYDLVINAFVRDDILISNFLSDLVQCVKKQNFNIEETR